MQVPILATAAGVCSFMGCFTLVGGGMYGLLTTFILLASMLVAVGALAQWVIYFREWVRFEIESHEERTKTK